jgi:hypothetical protein
VVDADAEQSHEPGIRAMRRCGSRARSRRFQNVGACDALHANDPVKINRRVFISKSLKTFILNKLSRAFRLRTDQATQIHPVPADLEPIWGRFWGPSGG